MELNKTLIKNLIWRECSFWSMVDIKNDENCWNWKASKFTEGYGQTSIRYSDISKRINMNASRLAYLLAYGYIPDKTFVCHDCNNPACCNPKHLFLGTHDDNMRDMKEKGRGCLGEKNGLRLHPESIIKGNKHYSKIFPEKIVRGEKHGMSKLKEKEVLEIYNLYFVKQIKQIDIAKIYNVSKYAISDITRGKTWSYLFKEHYES
jgi:hypothetical protein